MARKNRRNKKITKYRRPLHVNIGMVVFGAIFIYMVVSIVLYFTSSHVSPYEVRQGQITRNYTYTGIASREEKVVYADRAGYINYFVMDGEKVSTNSNVYTLDESGSLSDSLKESNIAEQELNESDLKEVQTSIENFNRVFDEASFADIYDFKNSLNNKVLEILSNTFASNLEDIGETSGLNINTADEPGVVTFTIDSMEGVTSDTVSSEMFEESDYTKNNLRLNELVSSGDPVYKLVTGERWSVIIEADKETAEELMLRESKRIQIRFIKDQAVVRADYEVIEKNGSYFVELQLVNSMVRFISERYIEIELLLENKTGLKIPESSIVEKDFYLIPEEYVSGGGVNVETVNDDGSTGAKKVETLLYNEVTDEEDETKVLEYYIDTNVLEKGDVLIRPDSNERFTVGKKEKLQGVYNINKGYAVFKQINILYQNNDYCIVEEGTKYGLSMYDHIVLDSSTVEEDDIVYTK